MLPRWCLLDDESGGGELIQTPLRHVLSDLALGRDRGHRRPGARTVISASVGQS
jgi:hypothetical protein